MATSVHTDINEPSSLIETRLGMEIASNQGIGTPAELKTDENGSMRLELILEPEKNLPVLPDFLVQIAASKHRLISRVEQENIPSALELATGLKNNSLIEEFSLSPTTLEDVYIKMVGNIEDEETPGGDG